MSGRINPREYDLGELRDAVDDRSRNEESGSRTNGHHAEEGERETDRSARSVKRRRPHANSDRSGGSTVEDSEAYLRARNRRNWSPTPPGQTDSTAGSDRLERNRDRKAQDGEDTRSGWDVAGDERTGMANARAVNTLYELHSGRDRHPSPCRDERRTDVDHHRDDRRNGVDLDFLAYRSEGNTSKPYLDTLPGTYGSQQEIFEWLDRLIWNAGTDGALSALEYYESIEWLSAESRAELERFVEGFGAVETRGGSLGVSDHRESLAYIARLAGRNRR